MNSNISPKYQMDLVLRVNERLFELYKGYENVEAYLKKWHSEEADYNNWVSEMSDL